MDWKDVPKYGEDGRFITKDDFTKVAADVAAEVAHEAHDLHIGLILSLYSVLILKKLFKEEEEDK